MAGILYIVSTPIGNLEDITLRALSIFKDVGIIACEDTRVSQKLLKHHGLLNRQKLKSLNQHNEHIVKREILELLNHGSSVALCSDAGTPIVQDPGFSLIQEALLSGIDVVPIPGPCSLTCALSVAGLKPHPMTFYGFIPPKATQREKFLEKIKEEAHTLIFFEAPHRIRETILAMYHTFGPSRRVSICREMTKMFETITRLTLSEIVENMDKTIEARGEFVIVVDGYQVEQSIDLTPSEKNLIQHLLEDLNASKAAKLAAKYFNKPKKVFYDYTLTLAQDSQTEPDL